MAMPAIGTVYFLGTAIALMVCTCTFLSFHTSPESQAPVNHSGHASLTVTEPEKMSALEVLQAQYPAHDSQRDVRSVGSSSSTDSENKSSWELSDAPNEVDENEPEFMRKPNLDILRMKKEKAADLQARLISMKSVGRKQWLTENWSSFPILKVDDLSRQFGDRMRRFFCSGRDQSPNVTSVRRVLLPASSPESSVDEMDEREICGTIGSSTFCRQRFVLTWMSPVSSFGPREKLSLESIFKWHPNACVVLLSRTMDSYPAREILEPFVARGYRIMAVTPDVEALFAGTPAATWLQRLRNGTGDPGSINLNQNLSNLMRLAALYKYGGIYLDADMVMLKPFDELRNTLGAQIQNKTTGVWTDLNNAVLVFDRAHPVVYEFLREFAETFDGSRWGWNGPDLVSRVVKKVVRVEHWQNCSSVSVLPVQAFYPVNWAEIVHLFPPVSPQQVKQLELMQQRTYAIHLWNSKSNDLQVKKGSILEILFKKSCLFCNVAGS